MTQDQIKTQLEQMIDSNSVSVVLLFLAEVCDQKAEHIRENWQDKSLAKTWQKPANQVRTLSGNIEI